MKLGFIGFGEVAYEMARGLKSEDLQGIVAYDPMKDDTRFGALVRERAATAEVTLLETSGSVINAADIIIAAVPGSRSIQVVETVIGSLNGHKIYADVSYIVAAYGQTKNSSPYRT